MGLKMDDLFGLMFAVVVAAVGLVGGQLYFDGKQLAVPAPPTHAAANNATVGAD
jgi:hypothetical protein